MSVRVRPSATAVTAACTALALLLGTGAMALWSTASAAPVTSAGDGSVVSTESPSGAPTLVVTASPSPAPAKAEKSGKAKKAKKPKKLTLAQLRDAVAEADAELAAITVERVRGQYALVQSQRRLAVVRIEAVKARNLATRAHDDLGRYAAAAYRGQQVPGDLAVLMAPPGNASETLRALQTLQQTGTIKSDIASFAAAAAQRADDLAQQAGTLSVEVARGAAALEIQRAEIVTMAKVTQKQLTTEVRRIAVAAAKARDRSCLEKAEVAAAFPNGLIPLEALCSIGIGNHLLRGDAAVAFVKLAKAYKKKFDTDICVTSSYRNRQLQAKLFAADPVMVALPGRSHHGLGLAVDFCGGIENFGTPEHRWMKKYAGDAKWFHPAWAEPGGVTPEPWHWEFAVAT